MQDAFRKVLLAVMAGCSGAPDGGVPSVDALIDGLDPDATSADAVPSDATFADAASVNNGGFIVPSRATKANTISKGQFVEVGDADWSCLGMPLDDPPSSVELFGGVTNLEAGPVGDASITAWGASPSDTLGTATSVPNGDFEMTLGMLPSGVSRYGFTIEANGYLSTIMPGRYYGSPVPFDFLRIIPASTADAYSSTVGETRDPLAVFATGMFIDCQQRLVSNAIAGVSNTPSTFQDAGGQTYYFGASQIGANAPVGRGVASVMNRDGRYMVNNVPPGSERYLQMWGFRDDGELQAGTLTLLGEVAIPSQPAQAVWAEAVPLQN